MSTRSSIAAKLTNGKFGIIYCHHDGYLDGVGLTLRKHYLDQAKIDELILLGNISSLNESMEITKETAYGDKTHLYDSFIAAKFGFGDSGQEYEYFWDGEKWHTRYVGYSREAKWGELLPESPTEQSK